MYIGHDTRKKIKKLRYTGRHKYVYVVYENIT